MKRILLPVLLALISTASSAEKPAVKKAQTPEQTCKAYAALVSERCGFDRGGAEDQCLLFHRMGTAAKCEETIKASLRCTSETAQKRDTATGQACNAARCDQFDLKLEACLKAHCAANKADPDCQALFKQ